MKAATAWSQLISFLPGAVAPLKSWKPPQKALARPPRDVETLAGGGAGLGPGAAVRPSPGSACRGLRAPPDVVPRGRGEAQNPPYL